MDIFGPQLFICFWGFNEHFKGNTPEALNEFRDKYKTWIANTKNRFAKDGHEPRFVLVSPMAFEKTSSSHLPDGVADNQSLAAYTQAIKQLARDKDIPYIETSVNLKRLSIQHRKNRLRK